MLISVLFVLIRVFRKSNRQCGISINKERKKKKKQKINPSILCLLGFCCYSSTSTSTINKALGEIGFSDDRKNSDVLLKDFFPCRNSYKQSNCVDAMEGKCQKQCESFPLKPFSNDSVHANSHPKPGYHRSLKSFTLQCISFMEMQITEPGGAQKMKCKGHLTSNTHTTHSTFLSEE